jgi:hypothetical protein
VRGSKRKTLRPEKWRELVNGKLADAHQHRYELLQSERPELNRFQDPDVYAKGLVGSGRGVFQVTHTLVGNPRTWPWYEGWLAQLSQEQRDLWRSMSEARQAEEHGEGPDLIQWEVKLPREVNSQHVFMNYAAVGVNPGDYGSSKFTVRFSGYSDRPASEIATKYIDLCAQFADDFERDHLRQTQASRA